MILGIQIGIFLTFLIIVTTQHGILNSISQSWYELKEKVLFSLFCYSLGFLHLFHEPGNIWYMLAGFSLVAVGAATRFKDGKYTTAIHVGGAILAIVLSFIGLWLKGIWFGPFLTAGTWLTFKMFKLKNRTWWVEVVAFVSIMISLYLVQNNII